MRSLLLRRVLWLAAVLPLASCSGDESGEDIVSQVSSVSLSPTTPELTAIGATVTLAATPKDATGKTLSGTTITWSSSDDAVAQVSQGGVVTARGNGMATITAKATSAQAEATGTTTVTVTQKAAAVTLTAPEDTLTAGQTMQLAASSQDSGGTPITDGAYAWTSTDEAVATVDANGLVTAVGAGSTTLAATRDGAKGEAGVTVLFVSVSVANDTTLGGTIVADTFNVAQGVTVTVNSDFVLRASGPITMAGAITGDCFALSIEGGSSVSLTGSLTNNCADTTATGGDVTIQADGALTMEGTTITTSGEVVIANAPAAASGTAGRWSAAALPWYGPQRSTAADSPCSFRNAKVARNPKRAPSGRDGHNLLVRCLGAATFWGGNGFNAQHGGHGDDDFDDEHAIGDDAGDGGSVRLEAMEGDMIFMAETHDAITGTELVAGNGGTGGDADAIADEPGGSATAEAGVGGDGGSVMVQTINGAIKIVEFRGLSSQVGAGGLGGDAFAEGANGADAGSEAAQNGGFADADGGIGGDGGAVGIDASGGYEGSANIIQAMASGGLGGDADAEAGNGGAGNEQFPDGAEGGAITADAGDGGEAAAGPGGEWLGAGGKGGDGSISGGKGGKGADRCPAGTGGKGGKGGDGDGDAAEGGDGIGSRMDGTWKVYASTGNGGAGGNGTTPGIGGDGGDHSEVEGDWPNAFQKGPNGGGCVVEAELGVSVTVNSDPAGHNPFVGMGSVDHVTVRVDGNTVTITGPGPWITQTGTTDGSTVSASGSGTAAGFSNVSTTFQGTLTRDANGAITGITGLLTVGANGELFGTPISYNVSG